MFDNLKIGSKMLVLSGAILAMLLMILTWGVVGLSNTADNGIEVSNGNKLRAELQDLEIKHLKWAHKVRDFLVDPEITELKVKLDHTTCALGNWYYGEGRKHAEAMLPEIKTDLASLEEPHRLLHASGKKIKSAYNPADKFNHQANAIFKSETQPNLAKIGSLMAGIIDTSNENIMADSEMVAAANSSRTGMTVVGIIALLLGTALAFLITRSLTGPMRSTVSMIEAMEQGKIDGRLHLSRKDEIGQMSSAMDRFADSLENEVVNSLQKLANGDLTFHISPRSSEDRIRNAIKQVGSDLNDIISQIQTAGLQINSASDQVADSSQTLSQGATKTAASLEEITSSMNEMAAQTTQSAENANQASQLASTASKAATKGGQQMDAMVAAMSEINAAGQNISKIIKVIDEIAFQTNLLALNAAVEAARAGQHGKGFAVVAEEVRNLAARSAKAASETAELIEGSVAKTQNGTQIAEETSAALHEIVDGITKVTDLVAEIAAASTEQAQGISQVNQGLGQIDQAVQQNTATAEESAAAAEELSSQSEQMKHMLSRFTLAGGQNRFSLSPQIAAAAAPPPNPTPQPVAQPAASLGWGESPSPEAHKAKPQIQLDDDEFGRY